ncbi:MAG: hypothetical protein IJZ03_07495 [Clostridia bacterium]|nr:hypothetical protein [Clostridia bacterium]
MKLKNILLSGLSLALVAALAIGGTIAYLQDSDSDVNVMTLGNVSIAQHEYERATNADGSYKTDATYGYVLKDFTQAKPLYPATELDANGNPYNYGAGDYGPTRVKMSQVGSHGSMDVFVNENAIDKFVTVENTGKTDAYVRTIIAMEIGSLTEARFDEVISTSSFMTAQGVWKVTDIGVVEIDGNNYYVSEYIYEGAKDLGGVHENGVLPAGDTTYPSLAQVYMKATATNEDVEKIDGNKNGTYEILVFSQAVQVDGFADAETALNAGFGDITTTNHPWTDGVKVPVTVSSADDMYAALDAGEKDLVVVGATIDENKFNGRYYKDRNVDFVDCTFTAHMNYMYINDATFTNCTFDCGADNAAVHYDELFGDLVFNNCTFKSGKIQIGTNKDMTATVTFNDCVFEETTSTSIWSEKGIRVYSPAEFNNCEFNNRVVVAGSNGLSVTFDSCTMNGGTPVYYVDNTDGIIRGGNIPVVTIK